MTARSSGGMFLELLMHKMGQVLFVHAFCGVDGDSSHDGCRRVPLHGVHAQRALLQLGSKRVMSETLFITRKGDHLVTATELVYSPDDHGYYLSQTDFLKKKRRTSARIFKTITAAREAFGATKIKWESWR